MGTARTWLASGIAALAGLAIAAEATSGFAAFTHASARRLDALERPQPVPALPLQFSDGTVRGLDQLGSPWLLVDFVYTGCTTLCAVQGALDAQLARALAPEIGAGQVRLLSISFDPVRDGPQQLRAFLAREAGGPSAGPPPDGPAWDAARPAHARDTQAWLDAFGVVVVADGFGGYAHNEATAIVDPKRRIAAILEAGDAARIAAEFRTVLRATTTAPRSAAAR